MKVVYIKTDDAGKVIYCDTNKFDGLIPVEVEDYLLDGMRMLSCRYIDGSFEFNENEHNQRIAQQQSKLEYVNNRKRDIAKLQSIELNRRLLLLTDEEAVSVMSLFPEYDDNKSYVVDERFVYNDELYKVIKQRKSAEEPVVLSTPDNDIVHYKKIS